MHRSRSVVSELIPSRPLGQRGWNPIKLAYKLADWPAQLATSAFSQLSILANSVSMSTVLVTGPTVIQNSLLSSLAVAVTITSTHFNYPQRDDQAKLAWVAWLNTEMVYARMVTHLNPAGWALILDISTQQHCATQCSDAVMQVVTKYNLQGKKDKCDKIRPWTWCCA